MVEGARVTRTFETARAAREWLEDTAVEAKAGRFVDHRPLVQSMVRDLVQRYKDEELKVGGGPRRT